MAAHYARRGVLAAIALGLLQGQQSDGCGKEIIDPAPQVDCGSDVSIQTLPGKCTDVPDCTKSTVPPAPFFSDEFELTLKGDIPSWLTMSMRDVGGRSVYQLCVAQDATLGDSGRVEIEAAKLPERASRPTFIVDIDLREFLLEIVGLHSAPYTINEQRTATARFPCATDPAFQCVPGSDLIYGWFLAPDAGDQAEGIEDLVATWQPVHSESVDLSNVRAGSYILTLVVTFAGFEMSASQPLVVSDGLVAGFTYAPLHPARPDSILLEYPSRTVEFTQNVEYLVAFDTKEYHWILDRRVAANSWERLGEADGATATFTLPENPNGQVLRAILRAKGQIGADSSSARTHWRTQFISVVQE